MSVDATRATWQLNKEQITSTEKLFLLSCADRAGETAECWPSLPRLAADTCLDIKTVKTARQSCIEKRLVEYTGEKKGRTKLIPVMRLLYVVHREDKEERCNKPKNGPDSRLNKPENGLHKEPENGPVKQARKRATEPKRVLNLKEESKSKDIVDSSNTTPTRKPSHYKKDDRFMRFYSVYPRKDKPADAWKAFKSLKPDDELLERIVNDVQQRTLKHTQWSDRQYIPLPASYLRAAGYDGEIYNEEEERLAKKAKAEKESNDRIKAQEDAYQKRISSEKQENYNKQNDGNIYRAIVKGVASGRTKMPDELRQLSEKLKRNTDHA